MESGNTWIPFAATYVSMRAHMAIWKNGQILIYAAMKLTSVVLMILIIAASVADAENLKAPYGEKTVPNRPYEIRQKQKPATPKKRHFSPKTEPQKRSYKHKRMGQPPIYDVVPPEEFLPPPPR